MKNLISYTLGLMLFTCVVSCSSNSKTSADSDTTPALSTKPTEQAPVNTATPMADTLHKDTTIKQ